MKKIIKILNTNLTLSIIFTIIIWIKSIIAYTVDFSLGISDPFQIILLILNPLPLTLAMFLLPLYLKNKNLQVFFLIFILVLNTLLILLNVIYYSEFTDFMTLNTVIGYSKVSKGLSSSSIELIKPHDIFYIIDLIIIAIILIYSLIIKVFKKPGFSFFKWLKKAKTISRKGNTAILTLSIMSFLLILSGSEIDRPQLLLRTFDRNYIVKYLGLDAFSFYDGFKTIQNTSASTTKVAQDVDQVLNFNEANHLPKDSSYFGSAKGKNVIIIHLESFQQFLINFKLDNQEVTPFLNSLIKDKNTISFDNFFNQVGQGKTSDAETMLETGTFGLSQGSFFTSIAQDNTLQAAPAILAQNGGYTSAVFHGNTAGFWNRNNVYRNLGYNFFFYNDYYYLNDSSNTEYGTKDKLLFGESIKYLEHLPQPFYAKYITVTNHIPYSLGDVDDSFPLAETKDETINHYFRTAHYLDSALKEFFTYLTNSGLMKNSLIMIYGDHYGISNERNPSLAPLLGLNSDDWNNYDNTMLQRVPLIFYANGLKGKESHTFGGEIDVLPTLLHLLGVNNENYIEFGQNLLNPYRNQIVTFRNHNFVTPKYTSVDGKIYDTSNGEIIGQNSKIEKEITDIQSKVNDQLNNSDLVNNSNLLRFYTPEGFIPVNIKNYSYNNQFQELIKLEHKSSKDHPSLYIKNGYNTTTQDYQTDAKELLDNPNEFSILPQTAFKNK